MLFDGAEIKEGDSVYDVAYGSGHITEVHERIGTFMVNFAGRNFIFKPTGIGTFPRKTLFWRNPIGSFIPPKSATVWSKYERVRDHILLALQE